MILQKIKINGFKSFAKPLTINFESPLTAVVGPNGSGKSNIVDAIRWVLGEQSAKTLRGSRMADIIFAGSDDHKPLHKASVTLYLDNSEQILPIDASQVRICRQVTEDGQSDYLINDSICRLKDIEELLMDTGLGKDSYSIVGQGKIDSILNSKPEKLRELFEEAAGISKHKARKAEAEKRLDKTNQDLQRVKDLIWELEKQLSPLKKAADRARKYERIQEELEVLEVNLLLDRWDKHSAELITSKEDNSFLKNKISSQGKELAGLNTKLETREEGLREEQDELELLHDQYFRTKAKREEVENNLKILEERRKGLQRERNNLESQLKESLEQRNELAESASSNEIKLRNVMEDKRELERDLKEKEALLQEKKEILKNGREDLFYLRNRILTDNNELNDINSELEKAKERSSYLEKNIEKIVDKRRELMDELNKKISAREGLEGELASIEEKMKTELAALKKIKRDQEEVRTDLNKYNEEHEQFKDRLNRKKSRLDVLQSMEKGLEGYYYGVKSILKTGDKFPGLVGVVADLLQVDKKYEQAVETALGSRIQNIVVKDDHTARQGVEYLKKNKAGRATFLPVNMIKGKPVNINKIGIKDMGGYLGLASEFVDCDDSLRSLIDYLLGRILIAEDLESATRIAKKINSRFKIVTLKGDFINPGGAITGGSSKGNNKSLLSRSREIEELNDEILLLEEELAAKVRKCQQNKDKLETLNSLEEEKREEVHLLELKKGDSNKDISSISNEELRLEKQLEELDTEFIEYHKQLETNDSRREELNQKLEMINNDYTDEKTEIKVKEDKLQNLEEENEDLKARITDIKVKIASIKQKRDNLIKEADSIELQLLSTEEKIDNSKENLEGISEKLERLEDKKSDLKELGEELELKTSELKIEYDEMDKMNKAKKNEIEKLRHLQQDAQENLNNLKEQAHKLDLKITRLEDRMDQNRERLLEEYELDPEAYDQNQAARIQIDDYKKVAAKVKELKDSIKRLGPINQGAIQEFDDLKSRIEYLDSQHQDLLEARESIITVIEELEENMGVLFNKTFLKVAEEFSSTFKELFGGGKAGLNLSTPEDLLDTGVEIVAQPPGKQLKKISLMSGGERALTAIALVFAFLKVNPSPFYILDEIDAPLDDANVVRFARFIKDFSRSVQFILITHRKGMMTEAETIYGVTMEESGISKMISLRLNEEIA